MSRPGGGAVPVLRSPLIVSLAPQRCATVRQSMPSSGTFSSVVELFR